MKCRAKIWQERSSKKDFEKGKKEKKGKKREKA